MSEKVEQKKIIIIQVIEFILDQGTNSFVTKTLKGVLTMQRMIGELVASNAKYELLSPVFDYSPGVQSLKIFCVAQMLSGTPVTENFTKPKEVENGKEQTKQTK